MFIPLLVVVGYWTLASVFNWYLVVVQPSGVRLTLVPFPTGSGQCIPREEITVCYAGHVVLTTEDGWETDRHFTMGVETRNGHQADIHCRYATADEALAAAHEVSLVLNSNTANNPIKVGLVSAVDSFPTLRRQILLWVLISVMAMMVGVTWDTITPSLVSMMFCGLTSR